MAKMVYKTSIALLILGLIGGCSGSHQSISGGSSPSKSNKTYQPASTPENHALLREYNQWKGTPYKFGGNTKAGVDCSAFVQSVYLSAEHKLLPRTTRDQMNAGYRVGYNDAKPGDLVFFKTSAKSRHVGIYLGNKAFMHASTSKGVIISRLDNPYWASAFWQVRRID